MSDPLRIEVTDPVWQKIRTWLDKERNKAQRNANQVTSPLSQRDSNCGAIRLIDSLIKAAERDDDDQNN